MHNEKFVLVEMLATLRKLTPTHKRYEKLEKAANINQFHQSLLESKLLFMFCYPRQITDFCKFSERLSDCI